MVSRTTEWPRVLIIIQNLSVPFDRRVWLECQTLRNAGYDVTVVCPRAEGAPKDEILDGVRVLTYPSVAPGGGALAYIYEYGYSFAATARLVLSARRKGKFRVLQACNPPDIFWPLARLLRRLDGTKFVFDHHDLCPELYESRFPGGSSTALKGLYWLERQTFHAADRVVSTNESYASVARTRGGKAAADVTVVRTGPDHLKLQAIAADPSLRRGRAHLVAYLGVMGPQDGVDVIVEAASLIVNEMGRTDIAFTLMGSGDCREELERRRDELGLQDQVLFTGRVPDEFVAAVLSTADVGLCPDPLNPLNDVSTMNKTMEYMAFGLPVLAYDLKETRASAQDAAWYVAEHTVRAFADSLVRLVDDAEERRQLGKVGRSRVETDLAWMHQQGHYLAVYNALAADRPGSLEQGQHPAVENSGR